MPWQLAQAAGEVVTVFREGLKTRRLSLCWFPAVTAAMTSRAFDIPGAFLAATPLVK